MTEALMYHIPVTSSNWQQHVTLAELAIEEIEYKMNGLGVTAKDVTRYVLLGFERSKIEQCIARLEIVYQ